MTDFQDARLGPYTYDLASFLRDSYAAHDNDFIDEMLDLYLSKIQERIRQEYHSDDLNEITFLQQFPLNEDQEEGERFKKEFDLTCVQRNIKAIGTFAFQSQVKKNHYYLQYIPITLDYIKRNLKKLSIDISPLHFIISRQESC